MSSNFLLFHTSGGISSSSTAFLFLIFLRTESSSSWVNGPYLMSNCLQIILVIVSCVTFGGFPSRFSKCCFHSFILSCWFSAFSFALTVLFLQITSFIVFQAILDDLSFTESLILSIWFCMYSVSSFIYMPANWYWPWKSFSFRLCVFDLHTHTPTHKQTHTHENAHTHTRTHTHTHTYIYIYIYIHKQSKIFRKNGRTSKSTQWNFSERLNTKFNIIYLSPFEPRSS